MALQSVGRILEFYNKTQQYLSFGFGAKVPNYNYDVLHDFPLVSFLIYLQNSSRR